MSFPPSSYIILYHYMTYSRGIETSSLSDKVTCQAARSIPSLSTTARCPGMLGLPVIPGMHHTWHARCFARLRERQKLRRNLRLAPRFNLVLLDNKSRLDLWSCLHVYQIQAQKREYQTTVPWSSTANKPWRESYDFDILAQVYDKAYMVKVFLFFVPLAILPYCISLCQLLGLRGTWREGPNFKAGHRFGHCSKTFDFWGVLL